MGDIIFLKKELRDKLLIKRRAIDHDSREKLDDILFNKVTSLDAYKKAEVLLAYYPVKGEVNLIPIISDALEKGKKVALPVSDTHTCTLTFGYITKLDELIVGSYSIPEPPTDALTFEGNDKCLCIVPALAFDRGGARIGYGKGYYDRFLADFDGTCLGICYDEFLLDSIPLETTDISVDIIVTDREEIFLNE